MPGRRRRLVHVSISRDDQVGAQLCDLLRRQQAQRSDASLDRVVLFADEGEGA